MRLKKKNNLKRIIAFMVTCMIVLSGIANDNVHAVTYFNDGAEILVNQATYDMKKNVSAADMEMINADTKQYVQIVLLSNNQEVGRQNFDKSLQSWDLNLPAESANAYTAKCFMVEDLNSKADIANDTVYCVKNFTVGKIDGALTAKTAISLKSENVTVTLDGISSTFGVKSVKFKFVNSSGAVVYSALAKKNTATKYSLKVDSKKIKPGYGAYMVKAEITDNKSVCVALDKTAAFKFAGANTTVKVGSFSKLKGTFTVSTDKVFCIENTKNVYIKVWCLGEKKDSYTYKALKNKKGQYSCVVDVAKHGFHSGKYTIQVIVKSKKNNNFVVATKSKTLDLTNFVKYGTTNRKTFVKKIYIYNPTQTKNTYLSVASAKSKNADIKFYKGKYAKGRLEFTVKMGNLKYSGNINITYGVEQGGSRKAIKKCVYKAAEGEIQKSGWYYEKTAGGRTFKFYYKKGKKVNNLTSVLKLNKEQKLYIEVNRQKNRVTVYAYDEDKKSWCIPVISFKCSVGVSSMPTPKGTFRTDRKHRWKMLMGPSWGQYATHVVNGIYFHSIAGSTTDSYGVPWRQYNKLGTAASHGCIRLTVRDAKWIYDHAKLGTTVRVYDSVYAGPLTPQYVPKIPEGQNYDPTDPAVKKK
ncbi:MAG: L,D-transpeptidase family protein [Agathobacter sp.]|nr:L,D-transpeptidase family protein [Agathobacter sp.]